MEDITSYGPDITEELRRALSGSLRRPGVSATAPGDMLMNAWNTISSRMDVNEAEAKRAQLMQQERAQLMDAVSQYPPEIQKLFLNKATLPLGIKMVEQLEAEKLDAAHMARSPFSRGGEGAGPIPLGEGQPPGGAGGPRDRSFDALNWETGRPNKSRAAMAERELKHFNPAEVHTDRMYPQPSGGYSAMPGAMEALSEMEKRKAEAKTFGEVQEVSRPGDPGNVDFVSRARVLGLDNPPPVPSPLAGALTAGNRPSGPAMPPPPGGVEPELTPPEVMAKIRAADAARGGQPYVGSIAPGGEAVTQALPLSVPAPGGYSTRSPMGKTLDTNLAQEIPKLEGTHYLARSLLERIPEIKQAIKDTPGWAYGRLPHEVARIAESAGLLDKKDMQAFQTLNSAESALVGPMAAAVEQKLNQGFTDKDLAFLRQQLPSTQKTQTENEAGITAIEKFLRSQQNLTGQRIRQFNPQWEPAVNPNQPGAGGATVPGKRSSAEEGRGLPEGYWDMTAAGTPSVMSDARFDAPPDTPAPIDEGNVLTRTLKGIERGIGMGGVGVAGALPKSVADLMGLQQPAEEDVRLLRREGPQTTAGKGGEVFGEAAANPATYAPGATVPRAIASGILSGVTAPAATPQERKQSAVVSGVLGPVGTIIGNRLPQTEVARAEQEVARRGFEDVPLSQTQIAGKAGTWQAEGIAKQQAEALTRQRLQSVGIDAKKINPSELEAVSASLSADYAKIFPSNKGIRLSTDDASRLQTAFLPYKEVINHPDFVKGSPGIKELYDRSRRVENRDAPAMLPASVVQGALQDVARIEHPVMQAKMRNEISAFLKKDLTPAELEKFEKINTTFGNLADLKRMQVKDGLIVPSSIRKGSGEDAKAAANFVEQFNIQNPSPYRPGKGESLGALGGALGIGASVAGVPAAGYASLIAAPMLAHVGERGRGALQGAMGTSRALDASPDVKQLIEMLRSGAQLGPREWSEYARQRRDNAAQ